MPELIISSMNLSKASVEINGSETLFFVDNKIKSDIFAIQLLLDSNVSLGSEKIAI